MISTIQKKLLYGRAKKYADCLEGVQLYGFSEDVSEFHWHISQQASIYSLDSENTISINHPVEKDFVVESVVGLLGENNGFDFFYLFEGVLLVSFFVDDIHLFLNSVFKESGAYDVSLFFLKPDSIVVISDDEYCVGVYYVCR